MAQDIDLKHSQNNPLLMDWNTPFGTPPFESIKIEHYEPSFDVALASAKTDVDSIINNEDTPTFENTIVALENAGDKLNDIAAVLFNLNSAETSDELQKVARNVSPLLSDFSTYISLNDKLFEKIKHVYEHKEELELSDESKFLLEKSYKGFVRSGAELTGDRKIRYAEIAKELSQLTLLFGENVLKETNDFELHITKDEDLKGLPDSAKEAASMLAKSQNKEGWIFNLQFPSYFPFMQYAENRALREEMFIAHSTRCYKDNDRNNEEIIKKIVGLRAERAQLLGYKCHADFVLEERMAKSSDKVNAFLEELHRASRPIAQSEYREVQDYARSLGFDKKLQRWDWSFYSEKLKQKKFGFSDEDVKPYFELSKVKEGVFGLATQLYGITFKRNFEIELYHPDVEVYEVYDQDGSFLAVFYTDFFPREGKSGGAWMTDYRDQSCLNGKSIRPLVSIVCNFTKPTETKPSLLTFNEVTTLLHEFGHALHSILSQTTYSSLSGTSVYRDFVELPSQVMENWGTEKEWLDSFAKHYQTEESIPQELIQKIVDSQNFLAGYASERQLSFGMVDMAWHTLNTVPNDSVKEFEDKAMSSTELFDFIENSCFSTAFSHIFAGGYAAGYYGYKWAEVLDADAFMAFKESGDIYNKEVAHSFRKNILEKGGTKHPMDLFVSFRGKEPSIDALLIRSGLKK